MPFKETSRMEERIRMLLEHESGNWSVSELCRRHGVCRDTFYEWRKRKQSGDAEWFMDRSHAPLQCRQTTDEAIAAKVIAARRRFPYLGAAQASRDPRSSNPRDRLACGFDDRRHPQARGSDLVGKAAASPARPAAALHAGERTQRRVEHRLQGLVSHPRPAADRPADSGRQCQPFPDRAADY
jgi:transposase-like protein